MHNSIQVPIIQYIFYLFTHSADVTDRTKTVCHQTAALFDCQTHRNMNTWHLLLIYIYNPPTRVYEWHTRAIMNTNSIWLYYIWLSGHKSDFNGHWCLIRSLDTITTAFVIYIQLVNYIEFAWILDYKIYCFRIIRCIIIYDIIMCFVNTQDILENQT